MDKIEFTPDEQFEPPQPATVIGVDVAEPSFAEFAASLPDTAQGFVDAPPAPTASAPTNADPAGSFDMAGIDAPSPAPRRRKSLKKFQKMMDKFKTQVAEFPVMWFHNRAKEHPEWELDEKEREFLSDSIETVFEVLDIGVDIEPLSYTITSVYWVLLYPFAAFGFLFLSKQALVDAKQPTEDNDNV